MARTAQPLGLGQAFLAAEAPREAQLAGFHTRCPWGLSESALGREKNATEVKGLKARMGLQGWPGWLLFQEGSRAGRLHPCPGQTGLGGEETAYSKNQASRHS